MSYALQFEPQILRHSSANSYWVSDIDSHVSDDERYSLLQARIRSDDYFVTLATELEKVADLLGPQNLPESELLQQYSNELIYLDRNYEVRSKR